MNKFKVLSLAILCTVATSVAQGFIEPEVLSARALLSQSKAVPGSSLRLAVVATIKPGLHINSNAPAEEFLIPTILQMAPSPFITCDAVNYPEPVFVKFAFSESKLSVYEGEVSVFAVIRISPQAGLGMAQVQGELSYQGCNENSCFSPSEYKFILPLEIVREGTPVEQDTSAIFAAGMMAQSAQDLPAQKNDSANLQLTQDERRALDILEHGLIYALAAFFLVGLALNLTPCVYPVIPLTVSYFGGQSSRSRGSSFASALFYLLGIALSFALLGVLSGLAGKQWGFLFQSPWFVVVVATIILLMAASMFGAFEISVPTGLLTRFGGAREGLFGSLIMGLTVGVIIAPCAAGIIIGLVGLVAKLGLVAKGGLLFFVMGLGLGTPYLVLATFSGLLNRLPQSGMWMLWVKKFFGILLIGVAIYFITPQIELIYDKLLFMLGLLGVVGGLLLGFIGQEEQTRRFRLFRRIVGGMIILLGFFWLNESIHSKPSALPWIHYSGQSVEELTAAGKPVFVDFYADWCAPCKQLDRETFAESRVKEKFANFSIVKVDCTKPDAQTRVFMERFAVNGMPTLIFLAPSGHEISELREIGFVAPDKFLASLQRALQSQ